MNFIKGRILVLLALFSLSAWAETLEQEFFMDNSEVLTQIDIEQRKKMLHFYNSWVQVDMGDIAAGGKLSGSSFDAKNFPGAITGRTIYGGEAVLKAYLPNNYIVVQTSECGYYAQKRWVMNDTLSLFGVSTWVCGPACDGMVTLRVISPGGAVRLPVIPSFTLEDFFDSDSLQHYGLTSKELRSKFEMTFFRYEFTATDTMYVVNDTHRILDEERRKRYGKMWKGNCMPIVFKNGKFEALPVEWREFDHSFSRSDIEK